MKNFFAVLTFFLCIATCRPSLVSAGERETISWPGFYISEVDSALMERIAGKSFKEGCPLDPSQLRYITLLHHDGSGTVKTGELICNVKIAEDLLDIFHNLYLAGYPIESVRLIDDFDADDVKSMQANNTSCFNFRPVAGTKKLSRHAYGMAVDVNPLYNPYVKRRSDGSTYVSPPEGRPYADRSNGFDYKIDRNDLCYKEFTAHGFKWGGDWKSVKDYQHFEK